MIPDTKSTLLFALKPLVKKLLIIEIVIFRHFAHSVRSIIRKYRTQEVVRNKLEKDYETALCSLLALMVLEKTIVKNFAILFYFRPWVWFPLACQYYFLLALKPIVLLSIEIVTFHTFTL
jgi:hypothetical protein